MWGSSGAAVGLRAVGGDVGQLWGSSGAAVLPLSPPHSCPPRAPPLALLLLALPLLGLLLLLGRLGGGDLSPPPPMGAEPLRPGR